MQFNTVIPHSMPPEGVTKAALQSCIRAIAVQNEDGDSLLLNVLSMVPLPMESAASLVRQARRLGRESTLEALYCGIDLAVPEVYRDTSNSGILFFAVAVQDDDVSLVKFLYEMDDDFVLARPKKPPKDGSTKKLMPKKCKATAGHAEMLALMTESNAPRCRAWYKSNRIAGPSI